MTSFHLPHVPAPYHPPACIRRLVDRSEHWLQNETHPAVPTRDEPEDHGVDWSGISSNVIATLIAGLALSAVAGIGFIAYQVPRQMEMILFNQERARTQLTELADELRRLEENDRKQDERLTRIEAGR